jgi:hypothetical protein
MKGQWHMSKIGLVGAAFSVAVAVWSADAHASTIRMTPFGNAPVTAYIGSDASGQWIAWKNQTTGACAWHWIGDTTGINDNYFVAGGKGNDNLNVVTTTVTFCGFSIAAPLYNGHYVAINGIEGNDSVWSTGTSDTSLIGGLGNDWLVSGRGNAYLQGDAGNDKIWATGSGSGGIQDGADEDDCLLISKTSSPMQTTCGNGNNDRWSGPGTRPLDCEITDTKCCGFCL